MKKTLIINIANTIIHFEEDAYEALTVYLNGIKKHFASTEDNFEIVSDIEARIAEMLKELLIGQQKQVVSMDDVQQVMSRMGSINDFEVEEDQHAETRTASSGDKRLFRDTDDVLVAGVCSGLAHFLNVETKWIRLFFLISMLIGGFGILLYIILWIVVPRAVTRAEKMAMRGEISDLQGFKKSFDEEMAAFSAQMRKNTEQFQPYIKQGGSFVSNAAATLGKFIETAVKIFFKVIAVCIIVIGIGLLLALIIAVAAATALGDNDVFSYFPFSVVGTAYQEPMLLSGFITCFVPVLALVLFSIRVAFNKKAINKTLSFALLTIWLCGVSFTTYYITRITSEFKEYAELARTEKVIKFPEYTLLMDQSMLFTSQDSLRYQLTYKNMDGITVMEDRDNDHPFRWPRNVFISIEKAEGDSVTLTKFYQANGISFKKALQNAQNIDYKYTQQGNSINFSPRLLLKENTTWRAQEVRLLFRIPVGTVLNIGSGMHRYLDHYHWDCVDDDRPYTKWVMTETGLKCTTDKAESF